MTQPHIHRDIGYTENLLPEAVGPSNMAKAFVEQALASAKGAEDAPDPPSSSPGRRSPSPTSRSYSTRP